MEPQLPPQLLESEPHFFFVRGMVRSGTNWLSAVLNLHPKIINDGEFHFKHFENALALFCNQPWCTAYRNGDVREAAVQGTRSLVQSCLLPLRKIKPTAVWIGDRTPSNLVSRPLEPAVYIFILRDGRDVLVSWTYHQLKHGGLDAAFRDNCGVQLGLYQEKRKVFIDCPELLLASELWVRHIARIWASYCESYFNFRQLIESGMSKSQLLLVYYRDLFFDTERVRADIYRFLSLDPAEALPLSAATRTLPAEPREAELPHYRISAVGGWRHYFSENAKQWFREEAGEVLVRLGFENGEIW